MDIFLVKMCAMKQLPVISGSIIPLFLLQFLQLLQLTFILFPIALYYQLTIYPTPWSICATNPISADTFFLFCTYIFLVQG